MSRMIQRVGQFFVAIHPSEMRAMSTLYSDLYNLEVAKAAYLAMFGVELPDSEPNPWEGVSLGGIEDPDWEGGFRLMEIDGNLVGLHTFILNSSPDDLRQYIAAESAVEKRWEHSPTMSTARGGAYMARA